MKEAYYFPHDCNAHKDPKILALRLECGWEGVGIFWALVEILRDSPDYKYKFDLPTLELGLSTPQATLQATLEVGLRVGLFVREGDFFSSPSLDRRMGEIERRRSIFREAGRRGGIKSSQAQARLKPPSSNKGKERKGKKGDSVPSAPAFKKPLLEDVKSYCQERSNSVNAEKWLSYYEANGWRVGRNPMKDWRAAIRTWEGREFNTPQKQEADSWLQTK